MRKNRGEQLQMIKRVFSAVLICVLICISAFQSNADVLSDYQKKLNEINSQKSSNAKKIKQLEEDINWNKYKRDQLTKQLEELGLKKEEIEERISYLDSIIESLDGAIALAEQEYNEQMELLKDRLRVMYKRSTTVWEIEELLKSKSLNEFFLRVQVMKKIAEYDQMLLISIEKKGLEIERLKEQKQMEIEACIEQAKQYQEKIEGLNIDRSNLDKAIQRDTSNKQKYLEEQELLDKESKNVEQQLKNYRSNLTFGGKLIWPMPTNKNIASYYGNRLHPIYKVWKMHTGIDIGAKWNEAIVAAADGVVIYAGERGGYGNTIIIDHGDGITTLYAHINTRGILVKTGYKVDAGQQIAKAGMTGVATGPHLHFEVRKNGATQNPLNYVKP